MGKNLLQEAGERINYNKRSDAWTNLPENSDFHQKFWVIGEQMFSQLLSLLLQIGFVSL